MFWKKFIKQKTKTLNGSVVSSFDVPLIRQKMTMADGFKTEKEALDFGNNSCGAACLKMVLHAFDIKDVPNVKELTETAIKKGFYREPNGWLHKGIAEFAESFGLMAKTAKLKNVDSLIGEIESGSLIISSVSSNFNQEKRGGHLIVIKGLKIENGKLEKVYFNDPSAYGQEHSEIDGKSFLKSWTGNVIILKK